MGLLNNIAGKSLGAIGLKSVLNPDIGGTKELGADFSKLQVIEIVDRTARTEAEGFGFTLYGNFMPLIPFTFGGTQEIKKDYYPGNSEPVVQVLGPRENDLVIKGHFRTKRFKSAELRLAAQEYQEQVDAVRLRGNLLKISLGEWIRYGYLKECVFELNRLTDISYSLSFDIVGFNPPKDCKLIPDKDDNLISANRDIIAKAATELAAYRNFPSSMPRTLEDFLNAQINTVAAAINLVTGFVDGILSDAESINRSANRALGLIKNAQSTISVTGRRVGALEVSFTALGVGFASASDQTVATYDNVRHFHKMQRGMTSLTLLLAALREKYKKIIESVPIKRHLVKDGDNLQRISILYYNDGDMWKKIYDHNKLTTTELVSGTVLEIPRL